MGESAKVIAQADLKEFFRAELTEARSDLGVELSELAEYYVVNMLCDFTRRETSPTPGEEPLALIYKRATEAPPGSRAQIYKEMGDLALYVAGFFAEFVERSLVDLSYYISMGGGAYRRLSGLVSVRHQGDTFSELYGQLAVGFPMLVDVLHQVSDKARGHADRQEDLLKLYDRWVRTGSERTRRLLSERGLIPPANLPTDYVQ